MFFTDKNAVQCYKKHKTGFMIGVLSAIAAVGLLVFLYCYTSYKLKNAVSMQDAYILNSQNYVPNRIAYIDTEEELYGLAMRGDTEVYDVVYSTDNYFYVLFLDRAEEIRINQSVRNTGKARIYGVTSKFKNETVRWYALETLQESWEDITIDAEDIDSYLGYMQLNVGDPNPISLMAESSVGYWIAMLLFIAASIFLIHIYRPRLNRWKSITKEETEAVEAEISREGAAWMPNLQLYAGDESIISFERGIQVLRYDDILMIFVFSNIRDFKMCDEIKILDKHGFVHTIATVPVRLFKSLKVEDIWSELKYLTQTAKTKNANIYMDQNNAREVYSQKKYDELYRRAKSGEFE